MKRLILLMAVAMITGSIYAQGVSGGLKAGLNLANQKWDGNGLSVSPDGLTSFHVGLFLTAMFTENIGIQPELQYNSVGSQFHINGFETKTTMNYLSIPVLFRYSPIPVLNFHAGPQLGFFMGGKFEADGDEIDLDDVKTLDMGLAVGMGVDLPMGFIASARYVHGLANVSDGPDDDITVKNNVFQLSVGWKLFGLAD
jgi:hypothetical protein